MNPETEELVEAAATDSPKTESETETGGEAIANDEEVSSLQGNAEEIDYGELLRADMSELSEEFSQGSSMKITDLKNPVRYGALRDLGLTPKEAFLASGGRKERKDNRAHLSSSVPKAKSVAFSEIPRAELDAARELFADMSDSEIRNLYKKVTK